MTMPSLPAIGSTSWGTWGSAVHDRVAALPVNVKTYGATGDGTTNDTTAIQNAANAAGGGTLYFPKGASYYRVSTITIPSNTRVLFAPGAGLQALNDGAPVLTATSGTNIFVEGGTHHGGGRDLYGLGFVTFYQCTNVHVRDANFSGIATNSAAVLLQGTKHSSAINLRVTGGGYGVVAGALSTNGSPTADYNVIANNYITGTNYDSIFVTSSLSSTATTNVCRGNKILNNTVLNCNDAGIESGVGCRDTLISGNTVISSAGPNILLRDNTRARIVGNHSYDSAVGGTGSYAGGVAVLDQTAVSSIIEISDNHCEGNRVAGVNIDTSVGERILITGNTCVGNSGAGVLVNGTKNGTISGNMCILNTTGGINVWASGSNPGNYAVTGNTCINNTDAGIQTAGEDMVLTGNRCFDDRGTKLQTYGIRAFTGQANYALITGNNCRGNGHATLDISVDGGATNAKIAYNQGRYTTTGSA